MIKIDLRPSPTTLRQFACVSVVGVPLMAALVLRLSGDSAWDHPVLLWALGVGVVQCLLALAGLTALTRAIYVVLMVVTFPIGLVVSSVLLALVYFLVFTPIGLVFRLLGRDVLGRRLDPERASYWHERGAPRRLDSYFKLY